MRVVLGRIYLRLDFLQSINNAWRSITHERIEREDQCCFDVRCFGTASSDLPSILVRRCSVRRVSLSSLPMFVWQRR